MTRFFLVTIALLVLLVAWETVYRENRVRCPPPVTHGPVHIFVTNLDDAIAVTPHSVSSPINITVISSLDGGSNIECRSK